MSYTDIAPPPPAPPEWDLSLVGATVDERRAALCKFRLSLATRQAWPQRLVRVVAAEEAHSDDEEDVDESGLRILTAHAKEGRNPLIGTLFREMTEQGKELFLRSGPESEPIPGVRKYESDPKPTTLPAIPKNVSLDYFDPEYFNTVLTAQERATYQGQGVCLPAITRPELATDPLPVLLQSLHMSEADFDELYVEETMALYDLPSPSTVEVLAGYGLLALP